ncbi:MAG: hypothetical protein ACRD0N_11575 [Acidimicrobiales bacterium]
MDWSKIDAALAGALEGAGDRRLAVFVQVDTEQADPAVLAEWDLAPAGPAGVATAELSADDVAVLTEQSWLVRIQLSRRLRPLDRPDET